MAELIWARGQRTHRTSMGLREAHDEASSLYMSGQAAGVIVLDDEGREAARFEQTPSLLPPDWPPRGQPVSKVRPPDQDAIDASPHLDPVAPSEPAPTVVSLEPEEAPAPTNACLCCKGPLGAVYEDEIDRTPSGRIDAYRCPACGAPMPGLARARIERMYLASITHDVRIVEHPVPTATAMPPMQTGFWRQQ